MSIDAPMTPADLVMLHEGLAIVEDLDEAFVEIPAEQREQTAKDLAKGLAKYTRELLRSHTYHCKRAHELYLALDELAQLDEAQRNSAVVALAKLVWAADRSVDTDDLRAVFVAHKLDIDKLAGSA